MSIDMNNLGRDTSRNDDSKIGLYKRIVEGLEGQRAYLLVFAVSVLFVLSGLGNSGTAVVTGKIEFGILALFSFVFALIAVVIVVREVERNPGSGETVVTTGGTSPVGPEVTPVSESHAEASIGIGIGIELGDYSKAVNKIKELIDPSRGRRRHSLKLLSVTGRSTMQLWLKDLINQYAGYLDIELLVVDPRARTSI